MQCMLSTVYWARSSEQAVYCTPMVRLYGTVLDRKIRGKTVPVLSHAVLYCTLSVLCVLYIVLDYETDKLKLIKVRGILYFRRQWYCF